MKRASSAPSSSPYSKHLVERPSRRLRSFLLWALLAALRTAIIVARDANALLRRSELLILEMALDGRRLTKRESMWFFYRYPSFSGGRGGGGCLGRSAAHIQSPRCGPLYTCRLPFLYLVTDLKWKKRAGSTILHLTQWRTTKVV